MARHGIPAGDAYRYVAQIFLGLSDIAVREESTNFTDLAGEFATRGGINEQAAKHLRDSGALSEVSAALDAVLRRLKAAG